MHRGRAVSADDLKNIRFFKPNPGRWPWAEDLLLEKFAELRKVGIPVDGPYLKAKMLQLVPKLLVQTP